ncbi:MAG: MBOAT family O-acyltransferase [Crocinitomicaceae bacterium]
MVFSEIVFLLYFLPVFLALYFLSPKSLKNYVLLGSSILFYAWGAPVFVYITLASTLINFYLVQFMDRSENKQTKRWFLIGSIVLNIGLLAYYKYFNFFIENVNAVFESMGGDAVSWTDIVLPIGISFFTFQSLSYSLDVYRKVHTPLRKWSDYALYILMFPQMIAGPIVRFNSISDQITERTSTIDDKLLGFYRFCIGLGKKVLIANVVGAKADEIMGTSAEHILLIDFTHMDATVAWIGILAYTFQIYFDFSGYSDMAIGLGRMMGFKFPENFDNPYVSRSITEFWQRWHITLGRWMRDYLYIPLGGNRVKSKTRLFLNLWIVFLLSGLWHGASWGFVIWGAYHGLFLILDRIFLRKVLDRIGKIPSVLFTFFITALGWVIFKLEDTSQAMIYYKRLFSFEFEAIDFSKDKQFFTLLCVAIFFSFFTIFKLGKTIEQRVFYGRANTLFVVPMFVISIALFILSISSITSSNFNPFIYFRF